MIKTIFVSSWARERLSITSYKMALIYVITVFLLISHNILHDASRATEACTYLLRNAWYYKRATTYTFLEDFHLIY